MPAQGRWIAVPQAAPMSAPSWSFRIPVTGCTRIPNGLVMGPATGREPGSGVGPGTWAGGSQVTGGGVVPCGSNRMGGDFR